MSRRKSANFRSRRNLPLAFEPLRLVPSVDHYGTDAVSLSRDLSTIRGNFRCLEGANELNARNGARFGSTGRLFFQIVLSQRCVRAHSDF